MTTSAIRNLLDFAGVLVDALLDRLTRHVAAGVEWTVPETWRPDHIHLAAEGQGPCTFTGGGPEAAPACGLEGFHFHDGGTVYRTLRDYEATLR